MRTHCIECGAAFQRERNEKWKKLCLDCWRASKKPKTDELANLVREVEAWRSRAHFAELRLTLATKQAEQFDTDELKTLRRLVHPDRHGNSEAATRISQKINSLIGASNGRT